MQEILSFLNANAALVAVITIVGSAFKYFHLQTAESNQRQFKEYHDLIKRLVAGEPDQQAMWFDRQKAVIYELRHFPRYYPLTVRILQDLEAFWGVNKDRHETDPLYLDPNQFVLLQREILLTIKFIHKRRSWLFCRYCKAEKI